MSNPSKNTIKRIMRKALFDQKRYNCFFFFPRWQDDYDNIEVSKAYFLFNNVGASLYTMSKGTICNRNLNGINV